MLFDSFNYGKVFVSFVRKLENFIPVLSVVKLFSLVDLGFCCFGSLNYSNCLFCFDRACLMLNCSKTRMTSKFNEVLDV